MRFNRVGRAKGILFVAMANLLWGTVFVASQVGLDYTDPYALVFLRFAFSSAAIVSIIPFYGKAIHIMSELKRRDLWFISVIYSLGFVLQYVGQDMTGASEATLLSNLSPVLIPIFASALLKERLTKLHVAAILLGFLGLVLIASPNLSLGSYQLLGGSLLFASSCSYAFFTVIGKKREMVSIWSSFAIIIAVTVVLAPLAVFLGGFRAEGIVAAPLGLAIMGYLGLACTLLAITLYMKGLGAIPASDVAILVLLQILIGLMLSAVLLGEFLTLLQVLGAALILAALSLVLKLSKSP